MTGKQALFARLAEGHAGRITVVTPNTRLAQSLVLGFDDFQKNEKSWEAADILPFSSWVQRLYEDALYSDLPELPLLLTPAQEQWLWQEAVSNSGLLSIAETAEQCRQAWNLQHQWRLPRASGNEDAQAFTTWSLKYRDATKGDVDAARLPDLVLDLLGKLKLPKTVVAYAFDILPPQTKAFLDACASLGIEVFFCDSEKKESDPRRTSYPTARDELEAAARWARAKLEVRGQGPNSPSGSGDTGVRALTPNFRIGIVVPQLEQRRREVERVFTRVMQPGRNLPGAKQEALPFNISIGIPLVQYPAVALALRLLSLSNGELPFEEISRLIQSPFVGGAEREMGERAQLDVRLRRELDGNVSLAKLVANIEKAPELRKVLESVLSLGRNDGEKTKTASEWARHFSKLLEAAGFPGERAPDSAEFQTIAKWHEALGELSRLERVSGRVGFSNAFNTLRKICADTLFQPEGGAVPVQVLGVLESAGLAFDHLWVSGLTDEAWPLQSRANPFIPVAVQRAAGVPQASPETSLELDRRITEGWAAAAQEVVFSHPTKDKDRDLAPSPLISGFPEKPVEIPAFPRFRDAVFSTRKTTATTDSVGPPVRDLSIRGGTKVLSDQAACPFRAFAAHRLGAKELEAPEEGLDARDRGSLVHLLMKNLWAALKDSESLAGETGKAIDAAAAAAVREMEIEGRLAELEKQRLVRLASDWLEVERRRAPFTVVALERPHVVEVAGLQFSGRIDRMDRITGGDAPGHVLIDYKTAKSASTKHWEVPRPSDPQLPLYAISAREDIAAVAFAKVRSGEMRFVGLSREDKVLPSVKKQDQWEQLTKEWKQEAESLGEAFRKGEAKVDPKRDLQTCRYCAMHTLCRVYEKTNPLQEFEEEE